MKIYEIKAGAQGVDDLQQTEQPEPTPGTGEILVKMHAASLNYRDLMVISGKYFNGPVNRTTIPLSDGAGEVVAVGDDVDRFKVGDHVAGTFFQNWIDGPAKPEPRPALGAPADGVLAEFVVFHQNNAVLIPAHLSFEEGATLPCAGVTAWNALMVSGKCIQPGDTVLALGTGGVSIFALQFAKITGAKVIITSSSDEKLERARSLGADMCINYQEKPEWGQEVQQLTHGLGVECVVEVGGAGTFSKSMQSVAMAGKIAMIGVLAKPDGDTNPRPMVMKAANMHGIFVGNRSMFEQMNAAIETNKLKPVIDKVFSFAEVADAYRYQQSGAHFGKVVISI